MNLRWKLEIVIWTFARKTRPCFDSVSHITSPRLNSSFQQHPIIWSADEMFLWSSTRDLNKSPTCEPCVYEQQKRADCLNVSSTSPHASFPPGPGQLNTFRFVAKNFLINLMENRHEFSFSALFQPLVVFKLKFDFLWEKSNFEKIDFAFEKLAWLAWNCATPKAIRNLFLRNSRRRMEFFLQKSFFFVEQRAL